MMHEQRACPACGSAVGAGFRFCPSCGTSLAREEPAVGVPAEPPISYSDAPAVPISGGWTAERRLVSVLFIDLVGFTSISERLDPEDVREMQSRYFEAARSTVARYGGSLEKFIGDAVMAVWGTPVAHENDAERAVRAALDLVRAVGTLVAATGGRLEARAAVTTGEAAVSTDLLGEAMVTGDMVNTASRLQEAAETGAVLVDESTRRAVGGRLAFAPAGELALKGKAARVSAWRATLPAPRGDTEPLADGGPFVDRDAELAALLELAAGAARSRRTTLVTVVGVAGIGKSRLARELQTAAPDIRWLHGRPPRWGHGSAFAPLAEIVRSSLALADNAPAEVARRSVDEALARLLPDVAERERVAPRIRFLLDPSVPLETERDELYGAWRRYLEALAADAPIALVLDDMQWAEGELLDFLEHLATWSRRHRILVLVLARPELLDARPGWAGGIGGQQAIPLQRLPDDDVGTLLTSLAPDLPPAVAARVRDRAEGVPLYAVELARMLTERSGDRPADEIAVGDIPESLHALLAARIDGLPGPERAILLSAAVLGRRFRPEALAALASMEASELAERLGTLVRRQFLAMDDDPGSPGRGQLSFVQDLMREVAYGTLARRDRRRRHLAVVDHLMSDDHAAEDAADAVAQHLVAAHDALPTDPGETAAIAERAVAALWHAAEQARALHAPQRALAHLERAVTLATAADERAALAEAAAVAARAAARFDVAERHLRVAIGHREALGDARGATRDRTQLASVLLQAQRSDTALAELEAAVAAQDPEDGVQPELAAELARAYMLRDDAARAIEWSRRTLASDEGAAAADARISLGSALVHEGEIDAGLAELRRAVTDAEAGGFGTIELRARNNLAWITVSDDPRATLETARRGLEISERLGNREWSLHLLDIAAIVAIDTCEWDWALARLDEAEQGDLPSAYRLDYGATRAIIGALRGEPRPASLHAAAAVETDLDPHALGWMRIAEATTRLAEGDFAAAHANASAAADGMVGWDRAEALAIAGRAAAWRGDGAAAADALRRLEAEPRWGRVAEARLQTVRAAAEGLGPAGWAAADLTWLSALDTWRQLDLPLRESLALADRWRVRGDPTDLEAATDIFGRIGAMALTRLLAHAAA